MNDIYMFSDLFLPTFPYLEMQLYNYLVDQGASVTYVMHERDVRLSMPEVSDAFNKLNLKTISSPKQLSKIMPKNAMMVSRFAYKGDCGDAASAVKSSGKKVFMYDPSGVDIRFRAAPAHYLTAKSKSLKLAAIKKFPKHYRNIFTCGTIHYDGAFTTTVDKKLFMQKYGLNPDKKLLLLTPANPGEAWMTGLQDDYKKIVDIVTTRCPDYELAIKCHPLDYVANMSAQPGIVHKNQHYNGKGSWEVLAPSLPLIEPAEGYKAIKACDAVLNIRSSLAIEVPMFKKPLININREKYVTNWPFDKDVMMDVGMGELESVLNTGSFHTDDEACDRYVKSYALADGKAYIRTGNSILKVARGEI